MRRSSTASLFCKLSARVHNPPMHTKPSSPGGPTHLLSESFTEERSCDVVKPFYHAASISVTYLVPQLGMSQNAMQMILGFVVRHHLLDEEEAFVRILKRFHCRFSLLEKDNLVCFCTYFQCNSSLLIDTSR